MPNTIIEHIFLLLLHKQCAFAMENEIAKTSFLRIKWFPVFWTLRRHCVKRFNGRIKSRHVHREAEKRNQYSFVCIFLNTSQKLVNFWQLFGGDCKFFGGIPHPTKMSAIKTVRIGQEITRTERLWTRRKTQQLNDGEDRAAECRSCRLATGVAELLNAGLRQSQGGYVFYAGGSLAGAGYCR